MPRKPYPSDLTDTEWMKLLPLLPQENRLGSPREVELQEVMNALMYVADSKKLNNHIGAIWYFIHGYNAELART